MRLNFLASMHIFVVPIWFSFTLGAFSLSISMLMLLLLSSTVVTQFYITEAENEYVIKGNSAVMKCKIPSFVTDFVQVEAWINAEDGTELTHSNDTAASYGYYFINVLLFYIWLKCIPSFGFNLFFCSLCAVERKWEQLNFYEFCSTFSPQCDARISIFAHPSSAIEVMQLLSSAPRSHSN